LSNVGCGILITSAALCASARFAFAADTVNRSTTMSPARLLKCTNTQPFCAYCGWNANDSIPRSPCVDTRAEMSRNGVASTTPFWTTRMRPGRSCTKIRVASPGGEARKIGWFRPAQGISSSRIENGPCVA
jgi:hypothetical protein